MSNPSPEKINEATNAILSHWADGYGRIGYSEVHRLLTKVLCNGPALEDVGETAHAFKDKSEAVSCLNHRMQVPEWADWQVFRISDEMGFIFRRESTEKMLEVAYVVGNRLRCYCMRIVPYHDQRQYAYEFMKMFLVISKDMGK